MCNQRKENEHLPQPAEQHCLCSFPFIASLCPTKTGWAHAKQLSSQFLPLTFKGQGLTASNIHPRVRAVNTKPQLKTFNCFFRRIQHFQCSPSPWCLLRELLESQTLPVSCSFASAHHLPLKPTPHSCSSRIKTVFIKCFENISENKTKPQLIIIIIIKMMNWCREKM